MTTRIRSAHDTVLGPAAVVDVAVGVAADVVAVGAAVVAVADVHREKRTRSAAIHL